MKDGAHSLADEAGRVRALHEARVRREIESANALAPGSDTVPQRGSLMPAVVVLKGLPGPAEASGGAALSGVDGEAIAKALERLGYDPDKAFYAMTRPQPGPADEARIRRVRMLVEALDADLVVAVDAAAAEDLSRAHELDTIPFGNERRACGRRLVAIDGLESSLADDKLKARIWSQLQAALPRGPVY